MIVNAKTVVDFGTLQKFTRDSDLGATPQHRFHFESKIRSSGLRLAFYRSTSHELHTALFQNGWACLSTTF